MNEVVEEGSEPKEGNHQHKCWGCGTVWEHADSCSKSVEAHECPNCERLQAFHYDPQQDKHTARKWPPYEPFWR